MVDSVIQRFPQGLLPTLGIKASETPGTLDQRVSPSIEMLWFYLAERSETVQATAAAISAVATVTLQVPAGEYWYIWALTGIAANISAPGANVQLVTGVQTPDGNGPALGAMPAPTVSIAGQNIRVVGNVPTGLLLRPGSFIFAATEVDPGAQTLDLLVRALIARLSSTS